MVSSTHSIPTIGSPGRLRILAIPVLGLASVLVVTLLLVLDRVRVATQQQLTHVRLGMPLKWITQDQLLDPAFPYRTQLRSPWENITTIDWLPLALNLVVVGLVLVGLGRVLRGSRSQAVKR